LQYHSILNLSPNQAAFAAKNPRISPFAAVVLQTTERHVMTESRPTRPPLATIICIYEVCIAAFAVANPFLVRLLIAHNASMARRPHPSPVFTLQSELGWLHSALAVAAAVALWQMRRSAFVLFLGRFVLGLFLSLSRLPRFLQLTAHTRALRPPGSDASAILTLILWIIYAITVALLALNAVFAWYAYRITAPKASSPPLAEPAPGA
jgi:hypothetical protein